MSPLRRVGRRPDSWASPHERARVRAAERLEAPLRASEAAWLDAHLETCANCASIAAAYEADRLALRRIRESPPEPPRDLWARIAAAIDGEAPARRTRRFSTRRVRRPGAAVGALSALAVAVVVVVASVLSGGFFGRGQIALASLPPRASALVSFHAAATPIIVDAGDVRWLGVRSDGALAYNVTSVDTVCPLDRQPDCAPLADGHARPVTLTATPKFVFQSPVDAQAIVVGTDAAGADAVIVVPLPTPEPTPGTSSSPGSTTLESPLPESASPMTESPSSAASPSDDASSSPTPSEGPIVSDASALTPLLSQAATPSASLGSAMAIITNV